MIARNGIGKCWLLSVWILLRCSSVSIINKSNRMLFNLFHSFLLMNYVNVWYHPIGKYKITVSYTLSRFYNLNKALFIHSRKDIFNKIRKFIKVFFIYFARMTSFTGGLIPKSICWYFCTLLICFIICFLSTCFLL